MHQEVYIDIVFAANLLMDYILLRLTGTESQKKQQKISEKSGSKKAAQHDFYHGDRVAAYSCGGSFFCVKIKQN